MHDLHACGRAEALRICHVSLINAKKKKILHLTFWRNFGCDSCMSEAMNSITAVGKSERNQSKSNVSCIKLEKGRGWRGFGANTTRETEYN